MAKNHVLIKAVFMILLGLEVFMGSMKLWQAGLGFLCWLVLRLEITISTPTNYYPYTTQMGHKNLPGYYAKRLWCFFGFYSFSTISAYV